MTYVPAQADPESALPLQGMTVLLDAGHGGKDPGAVIGSIYEKDINLPIALYAETALESMGAEVVLTRQGDTYVSVYAREALIGLHILERASGLVGFSNLFDHAAYRTDFNTILAENTGDADGSMTGRGMFLGFGAREEVRRLLDVQRQFSDTIVVSIHANSAASYVRGLQVYYATSDYLYDSEQTQIRQDQDVDHYGYPVFAAYTDYGDDARIWLANAVYQGIAAQVPALGAGASSGLRQKNFTILRENNLSAILVETGFMSNPEDLAMLTSSVYQERIAQGIAQGILEYFTGP